jgi:hypothetical protein
VVRNLKQEIEMREWWPKPNADYGFIELTEEWWLIVEVIAIAADKPKAWRALGTGERGCVIELTSKQWAACRAFRSTLMPGLYTECYAEHEPQFRSRWRRSPEDLDTHGYTSNQAHCIAVALKDLLLNGKVRMERLRDGDERWFALDGDLSQLKNTHRQYNHAMSQRRAAGSAT